MVKSDLISEPERVQVHILRMIIINAHLNYHAIIGDSAPSSAQSHLPPQAVSECKTETSTVADEADDDENDQYEHECVECGD